MHAAEDDNGNSHDDEEADNRVDDGLMTFDDVIVDGRSHVVGLQAVESEAKAEDEGYGKDDTEPALTESKLNVVCGATTKRAVRIAHLPDLGKRRLDERRCRADDGHEPHPENGARAANRNRRRDADDVARANARGRRDHERLERRDATLLLGLRGIRIGRAAMLVGSAWSLGQLARIDTVLDVVGELRIGRDAFAHEVREHVLDVANLHAACADGKPYARRNEKNYQDVGVHEVIDRARKSHEQAVEIFHVVSPSPLFTVMPYYILKGASDKTKRKWDKESS